MASSIVMLINPVCAFWKHLRSFAISQGMPWGGQVLSYHPGPFHLVSGTVFHSAAFTLSFTWLASPVSYSLIVECLSVGQWTLKMDPDPSFNCSPCYSHHHSIWTHTGPSPWEDVATYKSFLFCYISSDILMFLVHWYPDFSGPLWFHVTRG